MVGMQAIMQMELLFIAVQKTFIIGMICAHFVQSRSPSFKESMDVRASTLWTYVHRT